MADDSVVRPARRIIKIKFGNTVVATQAVRTSGLPSAPSLDSKETKAGSALQLAKLRQALLKGYVLPNATPDAIVAKLREGEGFAPGAEFPPWDFTAPLPCECQERPCKRTKQSAVVDGPRLEPCGSVPAPDEAIVAARPEPSAPISRRAAEPVKDVKPCTLKSEAASARPGTATGVAGEESNSDQATNSQAYLPLSPGEPAEGAARAAVVAVPKPRATCGGQSPPAFSAQPSTGPPQQRPRPADVSAPSTSQAAASSSFAATAVTQARERGPAAVSRGLPARPAESFSPAAPPCSDMQPSTSGRQPAPTSPAAGGRVLSGVSVETQTSQRDFPVLPASFLELPRLSGAALSYNSIGPFDLQLEHDQRIGLVNGSVDAHVDAARRIKREGDQLCNKNGRSWTIKSLSKYVSASLMFMEAAEAMLRKDRNLSRRAGDLYQQTAKLLGCTVHLSDSIKGSNGIGKEALRLLAERLCAICLLRQATLMAANFRACADKAQVALRDHQRQQTAQVQGAGGSLTGGPQPSPGDSSTSSLHAAHGGPGGTGAGAVAGAGSGGGGAQGTAHAAAGSHGGAAQSLPGFSPEQVNELVMYAKNACQFAEHMKRSSKSFEAFLERADVRQDQQAKLVCVHLAAVCMDMGMAGTGVIQHAREAVRTLCDDLAR